MIKVSDSFSLCSITVKDQCFRARIHNLQGKGDAIISIAWMAAIINILAAFFRRRKGLWIIKSLLSIKEGYSPGARAQMIFMIILPIN